MRAFKIRQWEIEKPDMKFSNIQKQDANMNFPTDDKSSPFVQMAALVQSMPADELTIKNIVTDLVHTSNVLNNRKAHSHAMEIVAAHLDLFASELYEADTEELIEELFVSSTVECRQELVLFNYERVERPLTFHYASLLYGLRNGQLLTDHDLSSYLRDECYNAARAVYNPYCRDLFRVFGLDFKQIPYITAERNQWLLSPACIFEGIAELIIEDKCSALAAWERSQLDRQLGLVIAEPSRPNRI